MSDTFADQAEKALQIIHQVKAGSPVNEYRAAGNQIGKLKAIRTNNVGSVFAMGVSSSASLSSPAPGIEPIAYAGTDSQRREPYGGAKHLTEKYEEQSAQYESWKGMMGPRGKVDENTRRVAAAAAWGYFRNGTPPIQTTARPRSEHLPQGDLSGA